MYCVFLCIDNKLVDGKESMLWIKREFVFFVVFFKYVGEKEVWRKECLRFGSFFGL